MHTRFRTSSLEPNLNMYIHGLHHYLQPHAIGSNNDRVFALVSWPHLPFPNNHCRGERRKELVRLQIQHCRVSTSSTGPPFGPPVGTGTQTPPHTGRVISPCSHFILSWLLELARITFDALHLTFGKFLDVV